MGCKPLGDLPGRAVLPRRSSVQWPKNDRLAVLLTFDCYGSEAVHVSKLMGTAFDYGPRRGVWHILESLDKLGVKATFNIPGVTAEAYPKTISAIAQAGHEVAALGYRYDPPWHLSEAEERQSIQKAVSALEGVVGHRPLGWRTPQSRPSFHTLPLLTELGFVWDSSLRNDEIPYIMEVDGGSLVEIPFGGACDDMNYWGGPFPTFSAASVLSVWEDELDVLYEEAHKQCSMFILCLHPFFVGAPVELSVLEQLVTRVKQLDGTWFARCGDVAAWWAQNRNWV